MSHPSDLKALIQGLLETNTIVSHGKCFAFVYKLFRFFLVLQGRVQAGKNTVGLNRDSYKRDL